AAYLEQIQDIPPEKIAYVDECGIDTYLYRKYGYAVRGQPVFGHIRGRKYKRCGIVAAKTADKILAPLQYSGTMDSALFELWFSNQLLPSLNKGTIIVMDNASFHSRKRLVCVAQNAECRLLFLPPYSPELNPIENFWAWLKRFLRKILPYEPSFDDALSTAFQLW
ncbi:MAG: IS630 family transposase, partial [Oscillospiraceae bacterium]|nr:IS630 family transposase [Oscillospiraceae bacterium]